MISRDGCLQCMYGDVELEIVITYLSLISCLCPLQLLVRRCSFGYHMYFVRSAVDSSLDCSTYSHI
jgi:hypothetical protein